MHSRRDCKTHVLDIGESILTMQVCLKRNFRSVIQKKGNMFLYMHCTLLIRIYLCGHAGMDEWLVTPTFPFSFYFPHMPPLIDLLCISLIRILGSVPL